MAAIRHIVQREVFQPNDERLVAIVNVSKLLKKKKTSFLCLSVTTDNPTCVNMSQVKKTDKSSFKKKRTWLLSDLKAVDGKGIGGDIHEFDLQFDKSYKWFAISLQERQNFLILLWKQCCKHLPKQKPTFTNIPPEWMEDSNFLVENEVTAAPDYVETAEPEDYIVLTDREEQDLQKLMAQCDFGISNAEAFMEMLARDLSILDGENVHSVLASERQVATLMAQMDAAVAEAEAVSARLDAYDEVLCHIRDTIQKVEGKNLVIEVANRNNQRLFAELEQVIFQLDLPTASVAALADADLASANGLRTAVAAAKALQAAMNAEIHPALVRLAAVQEQRKRFDKWKNKFSQTVTRHLNNLFIHLGNDGSETLSLHATELTLPRHDAIHRELEVYADLMHWSKSMDRKAYQALTKVYTGSLSKLYERDLRKFFEEAKERISGARGRGGSNQDLGKAGAAPGAGLLGTDRESGTGPGDTDAAERQRFDAVLERVLAQLEPVCLSEQRFCVAFFQLDVLTPTARNTQTTLDGLANEAADDADVSAAAVGALPAKKIEKQINAEVRRMMGELFGCIETELVNFIGYYEKIDSFYCMYVLVRLSQHVMSAQDTGSFLSMSFGSSLVQVKRNFDKFMQAQLKSIEEMKVNRKSKCGILPFVANFEDFARTAEEIFKNTERRNDLDKWYTRLVSAMFDSIPRNAAEHHKTPQEVVKMENFHHLYDLLSQLKITVLDGLRKDAKQRYTDSLKAYVTQYFGRPLEKLNIFFDGVQTKVAQGVKESEISYQMAYSKEQLRKVIREYPAREVKKGLENLYRKVEKHTCEMENLIQVVWRAMQEEFIQQYKSIEDLIQRCYPGSMITLDFSIKDILEFFSEIARSH